MARKSNQKPTDCIHAGKSRLPPSLGVNTPVVTSSAFDYRADHVRYPRYHNTLNHEVVAARVAALESGEAGLVTASGMGAISAVFLGLMKPGDHAILLDGIYGGTIDLVTGLLEPMGMRFSTWDGVPDSLPGLIGEKTRLVHVESPTNPLMDVVDLRAVARIAQAHELISVVDNTFATPLLQRPLEMGFDLVVHSGTKYLAGHSDLLCGAIVGSTKLIARLRPTVIRLGASLNGRELSLLERSIATLAVRVERQSANAGVLAKRLCEHGAVEAVYYPGLADHPNHDLAKAQMSDFGAMLSFRLSKAVDPDGFLDRLNLVRPAVSLGGVESTICQPSRTSHAKVEAATRNRLGIDDRLMRLSVGIEAVDDLWRDLDQALTPA
ncbi:MAG: PLP-dependent transferase [Wenzhouxiangella sp.]|nr:MAG: PLP-dependent transferase [Wenzhouxiangella sp.]